jgi:hypothetical protein
MECLWGLLRHRCPHGNCPQQNPAVFHVHVRSYLRLPRCYLPDLGFLAQPESLHEAKQKKPLASSLNITTELMTEIPRRVYLIGALACESGDYNNCASTCST